MGSDMADADWKNSNGCWVTPLLHAYGTSGSISRLGLVASSARADSGSFIINGFFFFCTAASYAEATAMFPEAGGRRASRGAR